MTCVFLAGLRLCLSSSRDRASRSRECIYSRDLAKLLSLAPRSDEDVEPLILRARDTARARKVARNKEVADVIKDTGFEFAPCDEGKCSAGTCLLGRRWVREAV